MAITVDDDEASAPDNNSRQSGGMSVPPVVHLLGLSSCFFLPADQQWPLIRPSRKNRHARSGQIERGR